MRRAIVMASGALVLAAAGCASPPVSTPAPTHSQQPSPSWTCSAADVLRRVDAMLAGQEFDAHYLTIDGELTISVWLVDPAIDPSATSATLAENNRIALDRGLRTSYRIVSDVPCLAETFARVNPMIVDREYNSWFIDFVPVAAFAGVAPSPTTEDLVAAVTSSGSAPSPGRRIVPSPREPASRACDWPKARAAIQGQLGPPSGNTAAYLIVGGNLLGQARWAASSRDDVGAEVQWAVESPGEATDQAVVDRFRRVASLAGCLDPPLDSLEAFVVRPDGRLVAYVKSGGLPTPIGGRPLPSGIIEIQRPTPAPEVP